MFEISNQVIPVFVPVLNRKVLYAFQLPQSNGLHIYDLDSLKEDDEFDINKSLDWCLINGTKKIKDYPYPIQFAYPATKEMFKLIDKTQMYLSDNWKVNWRQGTVQMCVKHSNCSCDDECLTRSVAYTFIREDHIKCIDLNTFETFFTHYKSLTNK